MTSEQGSDCPFAILWIGSGQPGWLYAQNPGQIVNGACRTIGWASAPRPCSCSPAPMFRPTCGSSGHRFWEHKTRSMTSRAGPFPARQERCALCWPSGGQSTKLSSNG